MLLYHIPTYVHQDQERPLGHFVRTAMAHRHRQPPRFRREQTLDPLDPCQQIAIRVGPSTCISPRPLTHQPQLGAIPHDLTYIHMYSGTYWPLVLGPSSAPSTSLAAGQHCNYHPHFCPYLDVPTPFSRTVESRNYNPYLTHLRHHRGSLLYVVLTRTNPDPILQQAPDLTLIWIPAFLSCVASP